MKSKINLILLSQSECDIFWPLGEILKINPNLTDLCKEILNQINNSHAIAIFTWDGKLGQPNIKLLQECINNKIDVWHAGLKLGLGGQPDFIDFVSPTWMLNCDPDPEIEATSWRLSLRCCLIRTEVLRQMGGPLPDFATLDAASLEMGLRYIRNGVFIRHIPGLLPEKIPSIPIKIPLKDQIHFLEVSYGKKWTNWASLRAVLSGRENIRNVIHTNQQLKHKPHSIRQIAQYHHPTSTPKVLTIEAKVSVVIPTVNRFPYLRVLLGQLRSQTVSPYEILIIDQTPEKDRDLSLQNDFKDLPIRWFYLDRAGQCSSRNLGLRCAAGNFILFIDDDDEVPEDLIESHLRELEVLQVQVSNGVANEVGAGPLPQDFTFQRISDVFPTNNTMIKKDLLHKSGLFDLAYDQGQRADGDLGMRVYLSGGRMVLNPDIEILHHHAPQGGLRTHKARVNTHVASRKKINLRVLPSISDIYLSRRYFTPKQVHEMLWISVLGTFSLHGPRWKQALKVLVSFFALPNTLWQIQERNQAVDKMFLHFPQIPTLDDYND